MIIGSMVIILLCSVNELRIRIQFKYSMLLYIKMNLIVLNCIKKVLVKLGFIV